MPSARLASNCLSVVLGGLGFALVRLCSGIKALSREVSRYASIASQRFG